MPNLSFAKQVNIEAETLEVTVLEPQRNVPALVVRVTMPKDKQLADIDHKCMRGMNLDMNKRRELIAQRFFHDWSGLTPANMKRLIPAVSWSGDTEADLFPGGEAPFDRGNAIFLATNSNHFFVRIMDAIEERKDSLREAETEEEEGRRNFVSGSGLPSA